MRQEKTYLGDAVYASFDGYQIELRTGDGNNQVIYLDPGVYAALQRFAAKCYVHPAVTEESASGSQS